MKDKLANEIRAKIRKSNEVQLRLLGAAELAKRAQELQRMSDAEQTVVQAFRSHVHPLAKAPEILEDFVGWWMPDLNFFIQEGKRKDAVAFLNALWLATHGEQQLDHSNSDYLRIDRFYIVFAAYAGGIYKIR